MVYLKPKQSLGYQQHSYLAIIIMHIYNWYHLNVTGIHYVHEYRLQYIWHSPLAFLSPLADSLLLPFLIPFTYLESLLAVTGSVHPGLRLLVN
jgi:hypothetical protein